MWYSLVGSLLPYAINILVNYIRSTDSSKDDMILNIVKEAASYLACKDNNTLDIETVKRIENAYIKE